MLSSWMQSQGSVRLSITTAMIAGALLGGATFASPRIAVSGDEPPSADTSKPTSLPRDPYYATPVSDEDMTTFLTANKNTPEWRRAHFRLLHWGGELPGPTRSGVEEMRRLRDLEYAREHPPVEKREIASYIVGSEVDTEALGGNFQSKENFPQEIPESLGVTGPPIELIATFDESADPPNYALYLVNRGDQQAEFRAADSRILITRQAKRDDGTWADIDESPNFFCGNSFHRVFLPSGDCWRMEVPLYRTGPDRAVRYLVRYEDRELVSNEVIMHVPDIAFTPPRK
jgi:hypothetical protein